MSVLLGILLDVSYSMKASINDGINDEGGTWARSIFTVIDDLIKHDVSRSNHVFAIGFGAKLPGDLVQHGDKIVDVLTTIHNFPLVENVGKGLISEETIENILVILEKNGACSIRKWTDNSIIKESAFEVDGRMFLSKLRCDKTFRKRYVYEYLPKGCRDWMTDDLYAYICIAPFVGLVQAIQACATYAVGRFRKATDEDVKNIVEIAIKYLRESMLVEVEEHSIYSVPKAGDIIRGRFGKPDLTGQSAQQLLKIIEPYIYGNTPLYAALRKTSDLFSKTLSKYEEQSKLLFVLSDGEPSDNGDLHNIRSQLQGSHVTVVGCYITRTRSSKVEPRRLYSLAEPRWNNGAKFLFNLSSYMRSDLVTRAVFIKQGWQMDITNNETRLFLHVNHPENLKDVCELSRNVVSSQEALSDLLTSISLDIYINQRNTSNRAPKQIGGTCYANASATVLHLSMRRILGRNGGYPDFNDLRDTLIERNGIEGANTFQVLRNICPTYRLHCKEVKVEGALQAIAAKRPVIAKFRLTDNEWETFRRFYKKSPNGILKTGDLDSNNRESSAELVGHAVVLTSYNSECLRLMNSWGDKWADMGFFGVETADVLDLKFMDVFWTEKDLSPNEKAYYRKNGSNVAARLVRSLRGLQEARFTCPLCDMTSKVTEFSGTLSNAVCPQCNQEFSSDIADDNILALNMYLTSLSSFNLHGGESQNATSSETYTNEMSTQKLTPPEFMARK